MARSTFEGPILSGDVRFGPQRNVGYAELTQQANILLTNTTPNTIAYGGASGQFVASNGITNTNGTVFTPGTNTPATITPDSASALYRGVVFYIPVGSTIKNVFIDTVVLPTNAGGALANISCFISNTFTIIPGILATSGFITSTGRITATYTPSQLAYGTSFATPLDVPGTNGNPGLSQVVITIAMQAAGGLTTVNAGQLVLTVSYIQNDPNIGSATAYPYGNFD